LFKHHFAAVIVGQLFPIFIYYIPLLLHSLMTKRGKREGGDLTKDNLDLNDDRDTAAHHANPFPKATADVLANRRIIRAARRPVGTSVAATIASSSSAQAEEKPFNPFANISLVAPPPPLPAPAMVAAVTEENSKTDENEELKIESKNGNEAVQPSSSSILNNSRVNQRSREAEEGNDKADETTKTSESSKRSRVTAASDAAAASNDAETTKTNTSESSSTTPVPLNTITTAPVFGSALAAAPAAATTSAVASSGFGSAVASGFGSALFGSSSSSSSSSSIGGFGFAAATGQGFGSATAASGFGSLKPSSHAPFSFGASSLSATTANSTTSTTESTDTIASSTEPVVAILPETYQIQSGEEDEVCALEVRVRTWRKDTGTAATDASTTAPALVAPPAHASVPPSTATNFGAPTTGTAATDTSTTVESSDDATPKPAPVKLTEVGKGPLRILRRRNGSSSSSTRVVQRQELSPNGAATKVILNVRLYPGSTTFYVAPESNVHVRLVTVNQHNAPESYTFKFVGAADAAKFVSTLNEILNEPGAESDTKQAAAAATDSVAND
jgi:NUP50 (Nucleoporin 50 kDa)